MPRNRYVLWGGIICILIVANIINYLYWNWGLITVKVTDVPLSKVIKSIEWQGWVKIYTNLPLDTKVTMQVDHVPLAEAMETLSANVDAPRADRGDRRPAPDQPRPDNNATASGNPPSGGAPGADGDRRNGNRGQGGPGGGRGGFGGGGFGGGGGVQWNLAFFVAPTAARVKDEIRSFQEGATDNDLLVYNYPTPLMIVATDSDVPASDPRSQSWPGYKPPIVPPPAPVADGQAPSEPSAPATPTVQTYLKAFAQSSNIWIMAPSSWSPEVVKAPEPNSSIITAVKSFVSNYRGSVTQAIILRAGRGGGRRAGGGGDYDTDAMTDRVRNAINGLPDPEDRANAMAQLDQEVKFYKDMQSAPPEQRGQLMRNHTMSKMAANAQARMDRMSPAKRAARYARAVSNRQTAQGKK